MRRVLGKIPVFIGAFSLCAGAGCMWIGGLSDYHLREDGGLLGEAGADGRANDGAAPARPSCRDLSPSCGPAQNRDCCASSPVPAGTFFRSYDGVPGGGFEDKGFPATVHDFSMDVYEVSVGRFRRFVAAYPGSLPIEGAGKNPHDANDHGWIAAWNTDGTLPRDRDALVQQLRCGPDATWSDPPSGHEALAQNCLSWFVAFAFCVWDGGRLPTEAEWNYAAAGGSDQRVYPWSDPPRSTDLDDSRAVYGGKPAVEIVGSRSPKGDGKWGHADLAGNLWEPMIDTVADYVVPCDGCGFAVPNTSHRDRGGCYGCNPPDVRVSPRGGGPPDRVREDVGVRCVRDP